MMRRDDTAPDANPATSQRILKEGACRVEDFFHSFCRQSANRFAAGVHTFDKPTAELFSTLFGHFHRPPEALRQLQPVA